MTRHQSGYGHHLEVTRRFSRLEIVVAADDSVNISVVSGLASPMAQISLTGDDMRELMGELARLYRDRE